MQKKREVVFLTNIPAPYRIDFYNDLHACGFYFEVWYMRAEVSYRPGWTFDPSRMKHKYFINQGFFKEIYSHPFFFNPALVIKALRRKNLELVLAASWNDVDVLILSFLKRIGLLRADLHFWSEANYLTNGARNDNFLKKIVRRFVYNHANTIQLSSGKMTELTLQKWAVRTDHVVQLPNTIEEEKYVLTEEHRIARRNQSKPVILVAARLIEKIKGHISFLSALEPGDFENCVFVFAGDGENRKDVEAFIEQNNLIGKVLLMGDCTVQRMAELYASANAFLLPSFTDASPLSVIEAIRMELPLLVSERCGNHYEAVRDGENGYLFNPEDKTSIRTAFRKFMARTHEWEQMGNTSAAIYNQIFKKSAVIDNFIKGFQQETSKKN